jgi:modification methylase
MESLHRVIIGDASEMSEVENRSIDLVVTSPPYPMIEMWDNGFSDADPSIASALAACDSRKAFECMHRILDKVWKELRRVVKPGGMVCINIGDATRTIDGVFELFANHARVIAAFVSLGFTQLPSILWRKPTNAPNKFMGSGMLPAGAYVTLEHEYILIFRLNGKRLFDSDAEKMSRRQSAFFWEERNEWFSDIWFDLRGASQPLNNAKIRERSGAFPLALPYRLINMFSLKADTVLDPFLGTGTTMLAAMSSGRHCVGYEIDSGFQTTLLQRLATVPEIANRMIEKRLQDHMAFIRHRISSNQAVKNHNQVYDFPVVTRQEVDLQFDPVRGLQFIGNDRFKVIHASHPLEGRQVDAPDLSEARGRMAELPHKPGKGRQLKLF